MKRSKEKISGLGEIAGATAAECAVLCCCFPCTLTNLLILMVYKVPAGLYKKSKRKKKQRGATMINNNDQEQEQEAEEMKTVVDTERSKDDGIHDFDWLHATSGFWRSPSPSPSS